MAVPPTNVEADAAVPPAGTPSRSLVNAFFRDLITTLAGKSASSHEHALADVTGLATALAAKADLLDVRTEALAFAITRANHANRIVLYTGVAASATLAAGHGLVAGDQIILYQAATAGAVTVTGVDVELSQGVAAAATAGPRCALVLMYDGAKLVALQRNQPDAVGAGGGGLGSASITTDVVAPDNTGNNVIYTLPLGVLPNGTALDIGVWLEQGAGTATADGGNLYMQINGQAVGQSPLQPSYGVGKVITRRVLIKSQTLQLGGIPGQNDNADGGDALMVSTADISAGATLTIHIEKFGAGKTITARGLHVSRV